MSFRIRRALIATFFLPGIAVALEAPRQTLRFSGPRTTAARLDLLRQGEAALAAGNPRDAEEWFERAGQMAHEADAELGQLRAMLAAGEFRRALAFAAHIAGVHQDNGAGAGMYAWLLHLSGQPRVAQETLERALERLPTDAVLLATRELLHAAQPQPAGVLLQTPARFAPLPRAAAGLPALPARFRGLASGVLVDPATVLTATAAIAGHERVWVRDGLGRTTGARITHRDAPSGLAELRLDTPLALAGPALAMPARDPFPGSPAFTVAYVTQGETPAWPMLRIGFVGGPASQPGLHLPGQALPADASGGALFDNGGRLIAVTTQAEGGGAHAVLPSRLRASGATMPPTANDAPARLPLDELYERALSRVVQVLSER